MFGLIKNLCASTIFGETSCSQFPVNELSSVSYTLRNKTGVFVFVRMTVEDRGLKVRSAGDEEPLTQHFCQLIEVSAPAALQ